MRGAMAAKLNCLHRTYYLPSMTGIATAIYENDARRRTVRASARSSANGSPTSLAGAERLAGTYPFTLATQRAGATASTSSCTGWSSRRIAQRSWPIRRRAFADAGLTDVERDLVRRRDWRGLIHYGVIFFMLEKLGAVIGVSNLHIYAAMRGETLEAFQKTRNAPGALYSVAGQRRGATGVGPGRRKPS